MIEGPDPTYLAASEDIPPELMELMGWGIDEEDVVCDWLRLPREQRSELFQKFRRFLDLPPSEIQLLLLLGVRPYRSNEAELLAFVKDVCRRLELSLQAAPEHR